MTFKLRCVCVDPTRLEVRKSKLITLCISFGQMLLLVTSLFFFVGAQSVEIRVGALFVGVYSQLS